MREERYHIALDKYDKNIVINALNTLRTRQLQEERPTEPVDELISKVAHAPTKKVKVVHCRCNEERCPENEPNPYCLRHTSCCMACPADSTLCQRRSCRDYPRYTRGDGQSA